MYCSRCGFILVANESYCRKCGAIVPAPSTIAVPTRMTSKENRLRSARLLVGGVCIITAILFASNLRPVAAWIGIIATVTFAVGWSIRAIEFRHKVTFVVFSLASIVGAEVSGCFLARQQAVEYQRRSEQIDAQNEAASRLKAQQEAEAFSNMTPAQHLSAARDGLRTGATLYQIAEGKKHVAALHGTSLDSQGEGLLDRYESEERRVERAQAASAAASAAREDKLDAEAQEVAREAYAKTLEKNLFSEDMEVDVDAIGPRHTILRIKWALASKVLAYKITESASMQQNLQDMRAIGFHKFVVWDGYHNSWSWTLDK